ncbi:MAG: hypothetical protein U1E14_07975 [Geminicoccaceae bacterium]
MSSARIARASLLALLLLPTAARAQLLSDRGDPLGQAYVARQVRAIEAMKATDPAMAAQQATALRSQLQRGVASTGSAAGNAVLQRRMEEVVLRQPLEARATVTPPTGTVAERPLAVPGSADDPLRLSPESALVADLLDRAELAYAEGRMVQARSDLAFATSQLGAAEGDAEAAGFRQRAARLAQQLR